MSPTIMFPLWVGRPPRLELSVHGHATEVSYRSLGSTARPDPRGPALHVARETWAGSHGLRPEDGAYLSELAPRGLTLDQLGEALAILSQTREMVRATIDRLLALGLVETSLVPGAGA